MGWLIYLTTSSLVPQRLESSLAALYFVGNWFFLLTSSPHSPLSICIEVYLAHFSYNHLFISFLAPQSSINLLHWSSPDRTRGLSPFLWSWYGKFCLYEGCHLSSSFSHMTVNRNHIDSGNSLEIHFLTLKLPFWGSPQCRELYHLSRDFFSLPQDMGAPQASIDMINLWLNWVGFSLMEVVLRGHLTPVEPFHIGLPSGSQVVGYQDELLLNLAPWVLSELRV